MKRAACIAAWLLTSLCCATAASADTFPAHPVKLVVTTGPGTGSDILARLISTQMSAALGETVIVDNRPGAGGITGMDQTARAKPDGYTVVLGANGTLIVNPALNPNANYRTERDFAPVVGLAQAPFVIVTANRGDGPKSLSELLTLLRSTSRDYASSGVGTITHIVTEMLLQRANVRATHIPYQGGKGLTDVVAGHVLFMAETLPAALPLIRSGQLRALATTGPERSPSLPEIPTMVQSGYPDFVAQAWWGLMAPAGTPEYERTKLATAAMQAMSNEAVARQVAGLELTSMNLGPTAFGAFISKETPFWLGAIRNANISLAQ